MEPHERIPHDDWADQDLLTRGEAAERLAQEIDRLREKLGGAETEDEALRRRLDALENALREMQLQIVNRANEFNG
jgi:chromosome segregation ATPase